MPTFYYQPGPAGSGKTYGLSHWAVERARNHEKVLIAQPTKELIRDTLKAIRAIDPDVVVKSLYTRHSWDRVTSRVVQHMEDATPHSGEILIVTHETLKRIPSNMRRFWHLVCDEVPDVLEHIDLCIAKTHRFVTDHIDASEEVGSGLLALKPGDRGALEAVQVNASGDQNIGSFNRLVNTLLSEDHLVLISRDQWLDLTTNPNHSGHVDFFAVLMSGFVEGYQTTTFMGANISETELFVIWSALLSINWVLHPQMGNKLRYQTHQNGNRLTIGYLFDARLSMRFLKLEDEQGETTFDKVTDFVARYWEDTPFLWQANKGAMPMGFAYEGKLPGKAHGLDKPHFKRFHNVALLSALNRKSAAYGFLDKLGISAEQAQATLSWQNDYQAMMRCSLRDPKAVTPVRIIVGSKAGAEWIASKFPGCVVEKLDHGIGEPRNVGRPKHHQTRAKTAAERMREYRARKKEKA